MRKSPPMTSDDTFYVTGGEFVRPAITAEDYKLLVLNFSELSANQEGGEM